MLARRPDTTLIVQKKTLATVRQFIEHVSDSGDITRPIGDLLIGAHANAQGYLFISMFPGQQGPTSFETLEETMNDPGHSIEIPDDTIGHSPENPIIHNFHIKGCNIGQATPFLTKLKEALGGNVRVTAPKHFHFLFDQKNFGTVEGMSYQFIITQSTPIDSRDDLLTAFQDTIFFDLYDGTDISNETWEEWMPAKIKKKYLKNNARIDKRVNVPLGQTIGTRSTVPFNIQFRTDVEKFIYTLTYNQASDIPGDQAGREQALEDALNEDDGFDAGHEYPIYERWGYNSLAEFLEGYTWSFSKKKNKLICNGKRYSYTLLPPILDSDTGNFICNYYPAAGSGNTAITDVLVFVDTRLFETV